MAGSETMEISADVRTSHTADSTVSQTLDRFGRIDVLINIAGITSFGSAADLPEAEWDRVLDTNLKSAFLWSQAVISPMKAQRAGRIINMGSILGKNGGNARPWIDQKEQLASANVAYGVSKAGVHALTIYLAKELAVDGITVNAVAPGPVASGMTEALPERILSLIPLGRMGTPEEVAETVMFLASEKSGFITGEIIDINGGMWVD